MSIQKELNKKIEEQRQKKYHILFVPTLSSAIAFYRMEQFVTQLRKDPDFSVAYTYHNPSYTNTCRWEWQLANDPKLLEEFEALCECADMVIFQAIHSRQSAALIHAIKDKYKIPVFSEFDDDPYSLPASHPSYETISPGSSVEAYSDNQITTSDGLIVSTNYLKTIFGQKNEKITVIPNSIDFELWDNLRKPKKRDDLIRIGYAGGSNHKEDLNLIYKPIKHITEKYPNVRFILYYGGEIPAKFRMKGVIHKDFRFWKPINEYPQFLRSLNFDIGLCPLRDRQFNRCKSNLKYLEYSAMSIPTIASPVEPYNSTTALFAKTECEWIGALEKLVTDESERKKRGLEAYNYVKENFNIEKTAASYKQLIKEAVGE